jgi:hypothetical protein
MTKNKRLTIVHNGVTIRKTCDVGYCDLKARHIDPNTNLKLCNFCFKRCATLQARYGASTGLKMFLDEVNLKEDAMQPIPKEMIGDELENIIDYVSI